MIRVTLLKKIYRYFNCYKKLLITSNLNSEISNKTVKEIWSREEPCYEQNNIIKDIYDLQIIIPVYNVEKYLEECIDSILNQKTKYSFGLVIVNDGSTDDSTCILNKYVSHKNIKIIHQKNRGFSGARNRALEEINGKYIMFVDSDDVLPKDAIENLMSVAINEDADIVAGGYNTFYDNTITGTYTLGKITKQVLVGEIPGFTCMKVVRANLLQNFCFPEGFLFEDTVLSKLIYPKCNKAYIVPDIVYNYRTRLGGISQTYNKERECIDTFWITKYCLEEAVRRNYPKDEHLYIEYLKQCYINYLRTRYLSEEVQECLFVLTADLLCQYWGEFKIKYPCKFKMLDKALKKKSFVAYQYILERWEAF